ncbi:MAG: prephenate dehydrogenase/arogenate dehydrogenase family protein [Thermoproteota archaeon]|nr:prephenate dehydrogenase/arogenate dehydrogenase family protein [Candidatus Brockarchaeota archaeon]
MSLKISIIGGCGAMGKWLINYLKSKGDFEITVSDPDEIEGSRIARTLGVNYVNDNKRAVENSDIVIVSVPVEVAPEVIAEVSPYMKEGSLLIDITSVKTEAVSSMLKNAPPTIELISVHPMFGPRIKDIKGQVVVVIPVRSEKWFEKIKSFLEKEGAEVVVTTCEEHDKMMSIVQGLTHFSSMVFASVIRELNVDLKQSRKFSTPIYNAFLPIVYRVVCQNPELYAQLQVHNPHVLRVQEEFISQAIRLNEETRKKNVKEIVRQIAESCKHFMATESSTVLLSISDRMVSTLQRERNVLERLIGRKICLENVQTGKIHIGVLKSVSANTIEIEESKKKIVTLSLFNVTLLDEKATMEVRRSVFGESNLDFSVILPIDFDPELCREIVEKLLPEAFKVEVLETYVGKQIPDGFKSITIRVHFPKDEDSKSIYVKAESILRRMGGKLR